MNSQLTASQAASLLGYLESRFTALCEHYEDCGFTESRADAALDELSGLRYGEAGSSLSPVDAILILYFINESGNYDDATVIAKLKEMKKQRKSEVRR